MRETQVRLNGTDKPAVADVVVTGIQSKVRRVIYYTKIRERPNTVYPITFKCLEKEQQIG